MTVRPAGEVLSCSLRHSKPLYLVAFDHRGSFEHDLFHAASPVPDDVRAAITDAKDLIFEAFAAWASAAPRGLRCRP